MRFGWSPGGSTPPAFPAANSVDYALSASTGWTHGLEKPNTFAPGYNAFTLPARGATTTSKDPMGFRTRPAPLGSSATGPERYYYALEIAPPTNAENPQTGPRMFPVIDDITIFYIPGDTPRVLHEALVVHD